MSCPPGWPDGVGLRRYDLVDSTNLEAERLAASGETGPLWLMARRQSAGHGRHGRPWISHPGNLFATLIMAAEPNNSAQTGFIAGISVADVIARYLPAHRVGMKWPNDVLAEGRKISGILVEHLSNRLIAIGIGINLATSPSEFDATSVYELSGFVAEPDEVLVLLARAMQGWIGIWQGRGFDPVRTAWIARAAGLGQPVHAVNGQTCLNGIFEDLDRDGALLLRDSQGAAHRITAADVYYRS